MVPILSGYLIVLPEYISMYNLFKLKRQLVKTDRLIQICYLPKYVKRSITHTNIFIYHNSMATVLCALEVQIQGEIVVLYDDSHTHYKFSQIVSILIHYMM